jgi:hypothetical protein
MALTHLGVDISRQYVPAESCSFFARAYSWCNARLIDPKSKIADREVSTFDAKAGIIIRMENAPAYARVVAGSLAHQWRNKRLFGKPYLKLGQCIGLSGYVFELGGLLAARHSTKLDAFGPAFLGMSGPAGAMKTFCLTAANDLVSKNLVNESRSSFDFVQAEFAHRMSHQGDPLDYCLAHMMDRIPLEIAAEFAWQCAGRAVAVAAIYPKIFQSIFERTYAPVPKEEWQRAYAAGLDIGPEQPRRSYEEAEEEENRDFIQYCRESRPDLYSILAT